MLAINRYPILCCTARIVKRKDVCWFLEVLQGFDRALYPAEALFLSLCNGKWTLEQIYQLCMRTYSISKEEVQQIFQNFESVLTLLEQPSKESLNYNPIDFICNSPSSTVSSEHFDAPIEMCLSLTHACNFRCIYCFNGSEKKSDNELSTEQWLSIVDQAYQLGVVKAIITGGEPMLHSGFLSILKRIVEYKMVPMICTNGSLITQSTIDYFQKLEIPFVQLSMDTSGKEDFETLTGKKNSYESVINAIKCLTDAGIRVVVKAVVMKENLNKIPNLVKLLDELKVFKLTLDRFDLGNSGRGNINMLISDSDIIKLQQQVSQISRPNGLSVIVVQAKKHWDTPKDIIPCGAFRRSFIVLPNGNVTACEKMIEPPQIIVGNLAKESLRDIWNGDQVYKFFNICVENVDPICQQCPHLDICGTGCFATKQVLGWPLYSVDPRCFKAPQDSNPYALL